MPLLRNFALAAGVLALCAGFLLHPPWSTTLVDYLDGIGHWLLGLALIGLALGRALRRPLAVGVGLVGIVVLTGFHGFAAMAATALLLLAALGLGSLIVPAPPEDRGYGRSRPIESPDTPSDAPWLALPLGMGLLAGGAGWLLPFPIFSQGAAVGVLLPIVLLLRQRILRQLAVARTTLGRAAGECPAGSLALALVLLYASVPAWLPAMSADDLGYHLQIGWQLQEHGYYRMDAGSQVWSLAPWLSDVSYGLLQLLAGAEGVAMLNVVWLCLTAWLIVRIGQTIELRGPLPWLAAMLYASIPLAGGLTPGMQTETASAAAVAALALLVLRAPAKPDARSLLAAAALAGALLGMKVLNGAFIAPLGLWLLWRWRFKLPWRALPQALLLGCFVAGSSYLYAWTLTGNPLLPLFNDWFQSPWFRAERFLDQRWLKGLDPLLPYWLSFRTGDYFETRTVTGAGGFALLFLLAGAIGAALDRRTLPLLLVGAAAWLLPFSQLQYLRYPLPALPLVLPVLLAGLATASNRRYLAIAAALVVLLQLVFQPAASWMLANGAPRALVKRGHDAVLRDIAPERLIAQRVRERGRDDDRMLIAHPDHPTHAELAGRGFVANWYDYELSQMIRRAPTEREGWSRAVARSGANLMLVRDSSLSKGVREFLHERAAEHVASEGRVSLYRLPWPAAPGHRLVAREGQIALRFDPGDKPGSTGDRLVSLRIELSCSQPHAPFAVGWRADREPGMPAWAYHRWVHCPASGQAMVELALALPRGWSSVYFEADPTEGRGPQALGLVAQSQIERPDLARERDLSRVVRQQVCRRWKLCRELERPLVLLASG